MMETLSKLTISQFKDEFRLICTDTWGNAMDAWFECAGHLHWRGESIPSEWEYRPGASGDGRDSESYWFDLFETTDTESLHLIGQFLFRYCEYLRFKGINY